MPDCRYCDTQFDDEASYHAHLESAHAEELGPIDRRRLHLDGDDENRFDVKTIALWIIIVIPLAVVGYVLIGGLDDGQSTDGSPYALGSIHEHGTLKVVIDGQNIDFSQSQFQYRSTGVQAFHFEGGQGYVWHVHAQGVTLQWALDSLGISITADTVRYDGTTYQDTDPNTSITITVDGQPVSPSEHVLRGVPEPVNADQGDSVRIVVNVTN